MKADIGITPIGYGLKDNVQASLIEVKPEGITLHFTRGHDDRTHRPQRYQVTLTPAVKTGSWTTDEDRGQVEQLTQKQGEGGTTILEGIWVEAGERQMFKVVLAP